VAAAAVTPSVKAYRIFREYVLRCYFPAHRLSWQQRWRLVPRLLFVEYLVYRVDSMAENTNAVPLEQDGNDDYDRLLRYKQLFLRLLTRMGAVDDAVRAQLDLGEAYVRLENRVTAGVEPPSEGDLLRLAELRPSDVRLLHAMTTALLRRPADQALMNVLWPAEVLADLGNDVVQFDADVRSGAFNVYAELSRRYDARADERMTEIVAGYLAEHRARLREIPPHRRDEIQRLCAALYEAKLHRYLAAADPRPAHGVGA
jgi:hypothetical protein